MANRTAEKIKRRKERLKENQTPVVVPKSNNRWFWVLAVISVSIIIFLSYLAYTSDSTNELVIPIIVAVIVLLLLIIWYLPKFYVRSLPIETGKNFDREKERLKLEDDTRKTFAQIIGGIVFLGGLIFTYNTFRLQQEGQFTDRFTKAVEQLGDEKLEIRLGGMYALERIAKDSPKDHWTVMEILSAYIREQTKKNVAEDNANKTISNKINDSRAVFKVATDIQAALTIIGRRKVEHDRENKEINLIGANLTGAVLDKLNFYRVNFHNADLSNAWLVNSDLRKANLNDANLKETLLLRTDLRGAYLEYAKNLEFDWMEHVIIDEETRLPDYLENRKIELLELSKRNLKERGKSLNEIILNLEEREKFLNENNQK